jgi:hypothetical protein
MRLGIVLVVWVTSRFQSGRYFLREKSYAQKIFWASVLVVFLASLKATGEQFSLWSADAVSRYLLPPHSTIYYFLRYVFYNFYLSHIVALLFGLTITYLAWYFNKKHHYKFFEKEELYFLALGLFLSGHPGWILYLIIIFIFTLLYAVSHWFVTKKAQRLSFYAWWLPLAALAIIINDILLTFPWYNNFALTV